MLAKNDVNEILLKNSLNVRQKYRINSIVLLLYPSYKIKSSSIFSNPSTCLNKCKSYSQIYYYHHLKNVLSPNKKKNENITQLFISLILKSYQVGINLFFSICLLLMFTHLITPVRPRPKKKIISNRKGRGLMYAFQPISKPNPGSVPNYLISLPNCVFFGTLPVSFSPIRLPIIRREDKNLPISKSWETNIWESISSNILHIGYPLSFMGIDLIVNYLKNYSFMGKPQMISSLIFLNQGHCGFLCTSLKVLKLHIYYECMSKRREEINLFLPFFFFSLIPFNDI